MPTLDASDRALLGSLLDRCGLVDVLMRIADHYEERSQAASGDVWTALQASRAVAQEEADIVAQLVADARHDIAMAIRHDGIELAREVLR